MGAERFELDGDTGGVNLVATNHDDSAALTVFRDGRRGSAELTGRDEAAVAAAIRNALDSADAAPPDPANAVAEVESAPPSYHGPERPDREGMLAAVRDYVGEVRRRFPLVRIRHAIYTFDDRRRSFANTAGVRRQERRAVHRFATMFGAKDGERSTSFNYTGASAYAPFERLIEAGAVEPLMTDTMRSFDPRPVSGKFTGDVIITPELRRVRRRNARSRLRRVRPDGWAHALCGSRGREGREPRVQHPEPACRPSVPGRLGLR